MNIINREKIVVNHLVDLCKDGRDFYRDAADKIENDDLEILFRKNAKIRQSIIKDLEAYIRQKGVVVRSKRNGEGKNKKFFDGLVSYLSSETNTNFVNRVAKAENRSLVEFNNAIADKITLDLKERIMAIVSEIRETHYRMSVLKEMMRIG